MREETIEKRLLQSPVEWELYLDFIQMFFKKRGIENPVVVELGVYENAQKRFYEERLGATHIGIDRKAWADPPDIVGDTHNVETLWRLRNMLNGRKVNLLFIDGSHGYESARIDFEFYEPLVQNIVAFHDICEPACGCSQLWQELFNDIRPWAKVVFYRFGPGAPNQVFRMGIGLIIKK